MNQSINNTLYTRASIVVFGGVCAVLMANHISNLSYNETRHALIPGFKFMAGLCYPILYFWVGLLLRTWKKNPKWWVQLIIFGISMYCLYFYRHFAENRWWYTGYLVITMAGLGFLVPPRVYVSFRHNKGWITALLLLASIFCYTTISTVKDRLLWGPLMKPEFSDMERMLEYILVNAEPLMAIVVTYFVVQFAFSKIAQYLGSQSWFRGIVAVPCIYTFFGALEYFVISIDHLSFFHYIPLKYFIVQPITIYLIIVGYRYIRELRKKKEDRMSWKVIFKP